MDFQICTQANFESQAERFLQDFLERGYSKSTISSHKSHLTRLKKYVFSLSEQTYTEKSAHVFIEDILPTLTVSESTKKHIRTTIRHFNDYLSHRPYTFRINNSAQLPPLIFRNVIDDYVTDMSTQGYKPATIEVRKIFAIQFLVSVYDQGIRSLKDVSGTHVGCSVLSAGSVEGMCQKLPYFLRYLHKKGLTGLELQNAVPSVISEKKLPSVYDTQELIQILAGINTTTLIGKRDYAILIILMTYGLRVKDLVELKLENIDFQHGYISFKQSKTGKPYCAELLPTVKDALESYLSETNPLLENRRLFYSTQAPYQPLSRGAVWSIVSGRIHSAVVADGRHQGPHAIRSSLASGLVSDNVPYPIVQKILGHTDPNATKRYVAIDIEQLRKCSIECPVATGKFLSYLEGGEWK